MAQDAVAQDAVANDAVAKTRPEQPSVSNQIGRQPASNQRITGEQQGRTTGENNWREQLARATGEIHRRERTGRSSSNLTQSSVFYAIFSDGFREQRER